jgi:hypothetical protein
MQHIEHLAGLGDRAEERIIATLPLLLAVEPHRRALGRFPCADHRAIEVERHARESKGHKPGHDPLSHECLQALCALCVRLRQSPRQRGDIRQTTQAERPHDQGVIRVVAYIAQSPVSQHEVQYQTQHQGRMSEDRADGEMAEAAAQPFFEPQTSEQRLEEDEARERGQLAVFKTQCGQAMGLAVDFGFAILHGKRSPSGMRLFAETHYTAKCRPLLRLSDHEIRLFIPLLDITGGDVQRDATNSLQPCLLCHFLTIRMEIYATRGEAPGESGMEV